MADLKLALEELCDESESGKLVRSGPVTPAPSGARRRLWPVVAIASVLVAVAAITWTYLHHREAAFQAADLVRLSPDDGYSYKTPSISDDGKFVAYVSDRGGSPQVWLRQVAGGDPIQLTHSADPVEGVSFFPGGASLIYGASSTDGGTNMAVIPTLGGQPRLVASTQWIRHAALAPDGRHGAYLEYDSSSSPARGRLMLRSLEGGEARELSNWTRIQPAQASFMPFAWTSDSRYLLCVGSKRAEALNLDEWEWFAIPVDGGAPRATGAGDALRVAGLKLAAPTLVAGDRVLFAGGKNERMNVWEMRLSPDSWRVRGAPRQLTFGTDNQVPFSVSASGVLALLIARPSADLYLLPLSPETGQPTGAPRRLTRDGRDKTWVGVGGESGSVYFFLEDPVSRLRNGYALDLESGKQTLVIPGLVSRPTPTISLDGRLVAYSIPEGNSYSVRVVNVGAAPGGGRALCTACGLALRFSGDGRFLFYRPESLVRPDPKRKYTVRLLDVASGKEKPWLEHPTGSIMGITTFGHDLDWIVIVVRSQPEPRIYLVPWREEPVPLSEWIEVKLPVKLQTANWTPHGNFFHFLQGGKLMGMRFEPKTHTLSQPYEVKYPPGSDMRVRPDDNWGLRGPGLVFSRQETNSSVWLMKLPR